METMTAKKVKSRYYTVRLEGDEIYTESVRKTVPMTSLRYEAMLKLKMIQTVLPQGMWSIMIEEQYDDRTYGTYDPEGNTIELSDPRGRRRGMR